MEKTVSIVIVVSQNSQEILRNCLNSIQKFWYEVDFEILVSDNATMDHCPKTLREEFPQVVVLENTENLGFCKGFNRALAKAKGRYVLSLNSDTVILDHSLKKMVEFLDSHPEIGCLAPRLKNPDGTIQRSCYSDPSLMGALLGNLGLHKILPELFLIHYFLNSVFDHQKARIVPNVMGAALLIPKSLLQDIGGLNEQYPMYSDDLDLCLEIRNRKKQVFFYPEAEIIHLGGQSSQQIWSHTEQAIQKTLSISYYFKKHRSKFSWQLFRLIFTIGGIFRFLFYFLISFIRKPFRSRALYQLNFLKGIWRPIS